MGDDRYADGHDAVSLRVAATELRRSAGAAEGSVDDYAALTDHFLKLPDGGKACIAYMRKLMHVSHRCPDAGKRAKHHLLAASVYLRAEQFGAASEMTARAHSIADQIADDDLSTECDIVARKVRRATSAATSGIKQTCFCGKKTPFPLCCGVADVTPAEFQVRAVTPSGATHDWPSSAGSSGLDLFLSVPPGAVGPPGWATWQADRGHQRLICLPNLSGRALQAAREMHAHAKANPNSLAGPSSAVLRCICALESFINSVTYLLRCSGVEYWERQGFKTIVLTKRYKAPLNVRWIEVSDGLFGEGWLHGEHLIGLKKLIAIRHALLHFQHNKFVETIAPAPYGGPTMLRNLSKRVELGREPAPWIDRLMNDSLSEWAIKLTDELITSFRTCWERKMTGEEAAISLGYFEPLRNQKIA